MCYVSSIYSNSFWYMTSARLLIWGQSLTSQPQVGSETIVGGTGEVRNTGWRYGAARVLFLTATSSRPIRANTTVAEPVDIIEAAGWIRNDCSSNSTVVEDQINVRMDLPPHQHRPYKSHHRCSREELVRWYLWLRCSPRHVSPLHHSSLNESVRGSASVILHKNYFFDEQHRVFMDERDVIRLIHNNIIMCIACEKFAGKS